MKYLACAFRNNILVRATKMESEQVTFFIENVASSTGTTPNKLQLVLYNLNNYEALADNTELVLKITSTKVTLVNFKDIETESHKQVNIDTATAAELAEYYSEEELLMINTNKQFMSSMSAEEKTQEVIILPYEIPARFKKETKKVKGETIVATIYPEV